jgi:uncharacterized membrane protein YoaK (UPF0700 family)
MKLLSPDARAERRLAICLAPIAGYVDAYGLIALGVYVSFMSGNTTQTGSLAGQGSVAAALPSALAIVFFLFGSFGGNWLIHSGLRHSRRLLFGAVSTLLAVIIGVTQLGRLRPAVGIAALSLAMGLMNTTLSHVGPVPVSLTFVTGTLNKLAHHFALSVLRLPVADAQGPWDTHLRRAGLLASIWAGFLTGAVLAAAVISYFGVWVLLAPLISLLALALFSSPDRQRATHSV